MSDGLCTVRWTAHLAQVRRLEALQRGAERGEECVEDVFARGERVLGVLRRAPPANRRQHTHMHIHLDAGGDAHRTTTDAPPRTVHARRSATQCAQCTRIAQR